MLAILQESPQMQRMWVKGSQAINIRVYGKREKHLTLW